MSSASWWHEDAEIKLSPETVEALARRVAELLAAPKSRQPERLVSAKVIAEQWGVDRRWVYEHADQLGARRLGSGPRPRLRFDPTEVGERLGSLCGRGRCDARR